MAELLAPVHTAVERSLTYVPTVEDTNPLFFDDLAGIGRMLVTALFLLVEIAAEQILLHLATIASSRQANLAEAA